MRMKKILAGVMCAAMLLGTATTAPMNAKACGRLYTTPQNGQVFATACNGTDSVFVKQNATTFTVYIKGSNCAYIGKSGNVTGVQWLGYKTVKGIKGGAYKVTIKKTKAPKGIGTVTFANGKKRVTLRLNSAATLNF